MSLIPAKDLVAKNPAHYPNESTKYREARNALLVEEIELRRHTERVAEMRRALPPGGEVVEDYRFETADGPKILSELFGDKDTLVLYSMMFGAQRKRPCPMCSAIVSGLNAAALDAADRMALAVTARSPIDRVTALKKERHWDFVQMISDTDGAYTRAYVSAKDADSPSLNVFSRCDGKVRHVWAWETTQEMADPGQNQRLTPEISPLWHLLDLTPVGREQYMPELKDIPGA